MLLHVLIKLLKDRKCDYELGNARIGTKLKIKCAINSSDGISETCQRGNLFLHVGQHGFLREWFKSKSDLINQLSVC